MRIARVSFPMIIMCALYPVILFSSFITARISISMLKLNSHYDWASVMNTILFRTRVSKWSCFHIDKLLYHDEGFFSSSIEYRVGKKFKFWVSKIEFRHTWFLSSKFKLFQFETRNCQLEARFSQLETRNVQLETRFSQLKTRIFQIKTPNLLLETSHLAQSDTHRTDVNISFLRHLRF